MPPSKLEVSLQSVGHILEMIRAREANTLLFFGLLVAVNAAVAGWVSQRDRSDKPPLRLLFLSMILANVVVAAGFGATGFEYFLWREQLYELQVGVPGLVLPAGFFHIGMIAVYVLTALVFALLWARGTKQLPARQSAGG